MAALATSVPYSAYASVGFLLLDGSLVFFWCGISFEALREQGALHCFVPQLWMFALVFFLQADVED